MNTPGPLPDIPPPSNLLRRLGPGLITGAANDDPSGIATYSQVGAQAKLFYATIAVSTLAGVGLNFTTINPVRALYWSAVVNGLLAGPVLAVIMLIAGNRRIMGRLTVSMPLLAIGWTGTLLILASSIAFFVL